MVGCVVMLGNCEMKGIRTWAILVVCIVECVSTTLGIVDFVPRELFTGILVIRVVGAVIDCEVEGVDVGAG
mgnify:CR=1 FL=1